MLKLIVLLLFISIAGLGLLQQIGVVTGIGIVDDRVAKLDSSLQSYAQSMVADPADDEDGVERLTNAVRSLVDQLLGPTEPELADQFEAAPDALKVASSPVLVTPKAPNGTPFDKTSPIRNEGFVVQVGAFREPSNAQRLAETLREHNADPWTYLLDDGLHAVRIGPFRARIFATAAAEEVEETTGLSPLVVRIN